MAEKADSQGERAENRRVQSQHLAEALQRKCEAHDIPIALQDGPLGAVVEMELPSGRERRHIFAASVDRLQQLLAVPFEKYVVIGELLAVCSYEEGTIEAVVESAGTAPARRVLNKRLEDDEGNVPEPLLSFRRSGLAVTLGTPSEDLRTLLVPGPRSQASIAIRISGASITRHDSAKDLLERIGNSLLLQLDMAFGVPLILSRVRRFSLARGPRQKGADGLEFPISEYDPQAMALYWYGRGASGMPLLQFLAFYQVLEFYFPIYADREIRQRVKNVVKNPLFKPHDEANISQIMRAMSAGGRRGFADERSQLRAAIRASTNPTALRDFLTSWEHRTKYFAERKKKYSPATTILKADTEDDDLLNATAERIYEIRCRIVHSKDSDGERGQLLPFSPEADRMDHDIALMEMLARSALVAASRELRV